MCFTSIPFKRKGAFRSGIPGENEGGATSVHIWREVTGLMLLKRKRKEQWQKYYQNMSEKKKTQAKDIACLCQTAIDIQSEKYSLLPMYSVQEIRATKEGNCPPSASKNDS